MIKAETLMKLPRSFKDLCQVYPPSVEEVLKEGGIGLRYNAILTETYEELHDEYVKDDPEIPEDRIPTPYKYILVNSYASEMVKEMYCKAFEFFLHEPVTIVPELEVIIIGKDEEHLDPDVDLDNPRLIKEEDFFDFQNYIRDAMGAKPVTEIEDFSNEHPKLRRMKALARERDRVAAKQKANDGTGISFDTSLVALCCMGIGINPLNVGEIAYASVTPIVKMFQAREDFDADMHFIYAGADAKKVKPEYWVRDFTDE